MCDDRKVIGVVALHEIEAHHHGHRFEIQLRMAPIVIDRDRHPYAESGHQRGINQQQAYLHAVPSDQFWFDTDCRDPVAFAHG